MYIVGARRLERLPCKVRDRGPEDRCEIVLTDATVIMNNGHMTYDVVYCYQRETFPSEGTLDSHYLKVSVHSNERIHLERTL